MIGRWDWVLEGGAFRILYSEIRYARCGANMQRFRSVQLPLLHVRVPVDGCRRRQQRAIEDVYVRSYFHADNPSVGRETRAAECTL